MKENCECVVEECPVQHRCGYLNAGTPCMHPEWRDKWRQKMKEKQEKESMKVDVRVVSGIEWVIEAAAWTQGTDIIRVSQKRWLAWLKSEHSPIRAFRLRIYIYGIPYYAHVHLVRHHVGVQPYVRSQRPTARNPVDYDRRAARQDALVDMILDVNPQSLINISRKRLCYKADPVTREIWEAVKTAIAAHGDPYVATIAEVMVPDCEYRGQCYELKSCGRFLPQNQEEGSKHATLSTPGTHS